MKLLTGTGVLALALCLGGCDGGGDKADAARSKAEAAQPNTEAAAADLDGARRFVASIYEPYTKDDPKPATDYFTTELKAAVERAEGLGADPFCECQDHGQFSYRIEAVEPSPAGATARVAISNFGEAQTILVHLVQQGGAWKVADVGEGENRLTQLLAQP